MYLASPHIKFNSKTSQITTYEFANFLTKYEFINFYQIVSLLKEKEGCYTKEARLYGCVTVGLNTRLPYGADSQLEWSVITDGFVRLLLLLLCTLSSSESYFRKNGLFYF